MKKILIATTFLAAAAAAWPLSAQTIDLKRAIDMSLSADPRIKEQDQVVEHARALLEEAQGNRGFKLDANAFIGLAPKVEGGFYEGGAFSGTTPRRDGGSINGLSDWTFLQFTLVKPLYTFGKIERYSEAAQGNIDVKRGDVRLARAATIHDVKRAYYGYLTARDTRKLLEDVQSKADGAIARTEKALKADDGTARNSDLYALQAGRGMLQKYLAQARAIETVSLNGLKVLTGVGLGGQLEVADQTIQPEPLPSATLAQLQEKATQNRPEMAQLESGLRARRALVAAKKAEMYPNIYAGLAGTASYASRRERLKNPYLYDPFNSAGITPVVGMKWDVQFDVVSAKVAQAQAELEQLVAKNQYAQAGIPFEVAEAYEQVQSNYLAYKELEKGAAASRRWMVAAFADFNAGLEKSDVVADALRTYALTQAEYLKTINDYNMAVAQLQRVTGDY